MHKVLLSTTSSFATWGCMEIFDTILNSDIKFAYPPYEILGTESMPDGKFCIKYIYKQPMMEVFNEILRFHTCT